LLPVPKEHHITKKIVEIMRSSYKVLANANFDTEIYRIVTTPDVLDTYERYYEELKTRPLHPTSNKEMLWSGMLPCKSWTALSANLDFCDKLDCLTCLNARVSTQSGFYEVCTAPTFSNKIDGFSVDILCEAVLGRVSPRSGNVPPPFYDSVAKDTWFSLWRTYTLPRRGVIPRYVVFFK
jgi:hypothetical protein